MSRTRQTKPWRLRDEADLKSRKKFWTDNTGVRYLSRLYNRQDRRRARADLDRERQPEPIQGRGRAIWDAW